MRVLFVLVVVAAAAWAGEVRGRVIDGTTKEPLARVSVEAGGVKVETDAQGRFVIHTEAAELVVSTVGYRPVRAPTAEELEIELFPQTLRRKESITVEAGAFGVEAPLAVALEGNELKNLASVLADDPLRAAQTLPGATSNDDFNAQVTVRGAGYDRVGLYYDGILLHQPFNTVQGVDTSGSMTVLNGDLLDGMNLFASALPSRFSDRTAGALDMRSRDGDRQRIHARLTASASNAGATVEGPWGKRASWIASVRQSYLQYIIQRTSDDPSLAFGFTDGQGRLNYEQTPRNSVTVAAFAGHSGLNRDTYIPKAGLNTLIYSDYSVGLVSVNWRATPNASWLVTNRAAYLNEKYTNSNKDSSPLGGGGYREWIWNGDASWGVRSTGLVEFGGSARRLRDDGFVYRYVLNPSTVRPLDLYRGSGLRSGAYGQGSRSLAAGKLTVTAGGRVDSIDIDGVTSVSPYASAGWQVMKSTRVSLAWGQALQYPGPSQFFSTFGSTALLPQRSTHTEAAVEQRLGERTRLRVEGYQRLDRDLLFRPASEARLDAAGRAVPAQPEAPWLNSVRAWSRGIQVFLQRRTANGFTGWVAYGYGQTGARDGTLNAHFPMDYDQHQSVQFYGSYRIRPSVNVSARYIYGSGWPVQGWYRGTPGDLYLYSQRNRVRVPDYQRADVRLNKSWQKNRVRWTLFLEVVNMFNHENLRPDEPGAYDPRTLKVRVNFVQMFPILPSAGVLVEF